MSFECRIDFARYWKHLQALGLVANFQALNYVEIVINNPPVANKKTAQNTSLSLSIKA